MTHPSDITIEVVDDDNDLRHTLVMVLRAQGFNVREHHSGPAYLSAERSGGIRLMLLDVRMPFMSGLKLHAEIRRIGDLMPVIFMSGENLPHEVSDDPEPDAVAFLWKPFRTQQLLQAIDLAVQSYTT
jgi:FixJ family two-component response regulator